jgi:hypothetical protein
MLIAKITHALEKHYSFRHTEKKDRTDDDFEILKVVMYDQTEFGQQGSLLCWYGGSEDFDWDNYDSDSDWGASAYFFGFQNFLEFYTSPSRIEGVRKLVVYTPRDDWSGDRPVVIDEIEYRGDQAEDEDLEFEDLFVRLLGNKYEIKQVSEESLANYLEK